MLVGWLCQFRKWGRHTLRQLGQSLLTPNMFLDDEDDGLSYDGEPYNDGIVFLIASFHDSASGLTLESILNSCNVLKRSPDERHYFLEKIQGF